MGAKYLVICKWWNIFKVTKGSALVHSVLKSRGLLATYGRGVVSKRKRMAEGLDENEN